VRAAAAHPTAAAALPARQHLPAARAHPQLLRRTRLDLRAALLLPPPRQRRLRRGLSQRRRLRLPLCQRPGRLRLLQRRQYAQPHATAHATHAAAAYETPHATAHAPTAHASPASAHPAADAADAPADAAAAPYT
jgi:hypothetical protein